MATLRRLHSGMAPPHAFNRQSAFIVVGAVGLSLGAAYVWARHGNGKRPAPELGTTAPSPGKAPPPRKKRSPWSPILSGLPSSPARRVRRRAEALSSMLERAS